LYPKFPWGDTVRGEVFGFNTGIMSIIKISSPPPISGPTSQAKHKRRHSRISGDKKCSGTLDDGMYARLGRSRAIWTIIKCNNFV
jgi:hypothetical protein